MRALGFGGLYPGMVGMSRGRRSGGASMSGVTKDTLGGRYFPSTNSEWTTTMSAAGISSGNPTGLWLMQAASGNQPDVYGTFTLTASGTGISYQQAVTGYSTKGIGFVDGDTGTLFSTSTSLPDVSTTSQLLLLYVSMPASAPAADRNIIKVGATGAQLRVSTTPALKLIAGSTVSGTANPTAAVRPLVLKVDRSTTAAVAAYSDQEKVSTTLGSITGKEVQLAGSSFASPGCVLLYAAMLVGTAAELTDAQVKMLLQTLGWTIPWT